MHISNSSLFSFSFIYTKKFNSLTSSGVETTHTKVLTYTNTPEYQGYMEHTSHQGIREIEYPTIHLAKLIGNMTPHAYPHHIHKLFTDRHLHLQKKQVEEEIRELDNRTHRRIPPDHTTQHTNPKDKRADQQIQK